MSIAPRAEPEADNAFGAIAKVFSALARFFGDPSVQEAGKRLFDELELNELPSSGTVGYELPGTVSPMLARPHYDDTDPGRMLE